MENLRDLIGLDPYEVVNEEGLVLVQPRQACPPGNDLPMGVTPFSRGPFLQVAETTLASQQDFLRGLQPQVVVFADCISFGSSKRFDHAVTQVFSKTPTVVLVHNTNHLGALVGKFAGMQTLYLLHDLRVHMGVADPCMAHVRRSNLSMVYGDCSALGVNHLVMDGEAAAMLAGVCPRLTELETNLEQMAALPLEILDLLNMGGKLRPWKSLILGSDQRNAEVLASPEIVSRAAQRSPVLSHLQVYSASVGAVHSIKGFNEITSLSIKLGSCFASFCYELLNKFNLTSLSLEGFVAIDLTKIAASCSRLRRLSLDICSIQVQLGSKITFPHLDTLDLHFMPNDELHSLLAACPNLLTLRLRSPEASSLFLSAFPGSLSPGSFSLKKLEQLELACPEPLRNFEASVVQLKRTFDSLPSLRYVAVDSYILRLFLENHMPHVKLGWHSCTVCAARFPKYNKEQSDIWHKVHPL